MQKMSDAAGFVYRGVKFFNLGNMKAAISAYLKALEIDPNDGDTYYKLGRALAQQDNFEIAVKCYRQAIQITPDAPEIHFQLANALKHLDKNEEAIAAYLNVIDLQPRHHLAYNNMAVAEHALGRLDDAVIHYQKALEIDSNAADIHSNLGKLYKDKGLPQYAAASYRRAIEFKPDFTEAHIELGNVLYAQCKIEEAIAAYDKSLTINPEHPVAHWDRSLALLLNGNFDEGWQEFEWRLQIAQGGTQWMTAFEKDFWDGSCFDGKRIFVCSEQGLGDTLQFVRFLPMVKALGGTVILGVNHLLLPLLSGLSGIDELVEISENRFPDIEFDLFCPIMSLPRIFETTLTNIPVDIPYLHATSDKISHWRKRLDNDDFKVGIVWKGSPLHANDRNRSCEIEHFLPLARIPGVKLYSLQKGPQADDLKKISTDLAIANLGADLKDFSDTAGLLSNLNLIISVDTAVVHLAGGMGVAVWTLLPFAPDWRWQLNRAVTPWYPSMQLFRQRHKGDWHNVFKQVAAKLHEEVVRL